MMTEYTLLLRLYKLLLLKKVWDYTKRIRNAAKATLGDDSSEVEKMGVVPVTSRRKKASI